MTTKEEILYNSIWRFLHLQEYVDSNHKLTPWGEVLATTIAALNGKPELEEAAIIAVELARLDLLNARYMFNYGGAPMRGTGKRLLERDGKTNPGGLTFRRYRPPKQLTRLTCCLSWKSPS